jgi:nitrogen fixation protein FixH
VVGRPASTSDDRQLDLAESDSGYAASLELAPGLWRIAIAGADAEGRSYEAEAEFEVKAPS